ncbi:MAG: xanthine dehydrogenase family protein [Gemmatimonadales bacterium]|jgi:CO/xanthine dehydrogenase Mo-binding subunit|nr:xanthine dehydrogenase family protein [Gemmatimonadales bacterium]MDG2241128.1 molybdopterin-dependent oxidoreductase [Longimicrobiales bacterium]MBT3775380.1 xanthine dehydrogenase family protein [Gemmatimonadales bacterium]MBT3959273.1 xanthine dehydrogenase family protein [Gemmatimonadales bacterium]MBT4437319.1 xanthine dehydrogenase family protein [Gemmatimonadales bacterium]
MAEKLIGTDIAPPDLIAKITGRAKYSEDFRRDGMVFAKLLLSPMPHCRVRGVDATRALAMPGVVGILRAEDVPQRDGPREAVLTDEPHYEGEPILAIAAETEELAAAAIEMIDLDLEPLPFVIDPLDSLRPGGPNAYSEGNRFADDEWTDVKWTEADFEAIDAGQMPDAQAVSEWSKGDPDAAFAAADVIIDEQIVHQSLTHDPMEPRSTMAYWENGKLYAHVSTQSAQRTKFGLARALDMDPENVILVAEYCGGGFGSKISGSTVMQLPAFFSRKINRPVMHRVTRAEEHYYGRARPGFQSWVKMAFQADGKCTGIDLFIVEEGGAYGSGDNGSAGMIADLVYTPQNMRFRSVSMYTNTPPKAAQRGPGGAQIISMLEPMLDKAARELGIDRYDIRMLNAPEGDVVFGPRDSTLTSVHAKEALVMGAEMFDWQGKLELSGRQEGTKVTGIGIGLSPYTAGSRGFDGLMMIRPDGKLYVHQGIGNLGTHSIADTARPAAEILGLNWDQVEIVWGNSSQGMPRSSVQAGSQTTHAHTRANHAAAMDALDKIQRLAARRMGGSPGAYSVDNGRVSGPGGSMTFAQIAQAAIAAGGAFDGHDLPEDIHPETVPAAEGLAGTGLMGVAKDNYGGEGGIYSWVAGFALVELDIETGVVDLKEYVGITDCGTVIHPRSLGAQVFGGSIQGMGMAMTQRWVFDPQYGVPFAKRFYTARPPGILDVPPDLKWGAVGIPDPQSPVGAKGIGEPPVGAGAAALTTAVADAMGGQCLCRTPLTPDIILAELEGRERAHGRLDQHVG